MVASIKSFRKTGLRDWLVQRVTSIVITAYLLFIISFIVTHPSITFIAWHNLFSNNAMRVFSLLFLLSLIAHSWIGLWTISTDYLKPTVIRLSFQIVIFLSLIAFFIWGIEILWGMGL